MDLVIRNASVGGAVGLVDIGVQGERVTRIVRGLGERGEVEIDAAGGLVTPGLVEPHVHLDAVLTEGEPRPNRSGSLFEGIEIWGERVRSVTREDVLRRGDVAMRWMLAHGVTHVRAHVDVCDPSLTALRALRELKETWRDVVSLQLVAFPQQGIYSFPNGEQLMIEALELGADVVGGIPHYE
ncbi:MAG TPA: amidohydrolase family protein, partial [Candidatus Methylomirabilis sp.]|nr:amidohydrolase family protein [Candidatus Methylomirabilis sp.]